MPNSGRPTPPPDPVADPREAAAAALDGLHWLFERATIYPSGHPEVDRARDRTVALLHEALATHGVLRLGAGRGALRLDQEPLDSLRCRSLGTLLFELDVVELEIERGVDADEILGLARDLSRLRSDGGRGAIREEFSEGGPYRHIRVRLIDYRAIRVDSGTQERPMGDDPERLWSALSQTILGPPDSPRTVAPEQLAELLGDEILCYEGVGAGGLSRQLHRLLQDVDHLPPESRQDAHARVARFLTALPRALREELLRIDAPTAPGEGDDGALRPELLATTLFFGAIRNAERPPEGAVTLMNQLIRTSSLDSGEKARLDELLRSAASGEATGPDLDRLGDAVQECFRNREDVHANPEDYQVFIDALARAGAIQVAPESTWQDLYGDPSAVEETHTHAVEIAVRQFEGLGTNEAAVGIAEFLSESTGRLVEGARFDVLDSAVSAAESYSMSGDGSDEGHAAAERFVEEATASDTVGRILAKIAAPEPEPEPVPVPDAALSLVRRSGARGVDAVVAALESGVSPAFAESLHEILLAQPPDLILRLAQDRADRGWRALRPLFPVLRRMTGPEVQAFLVELLGHAEESIRSKALSALDDDSVGAEWMEEALGPLLRDPSPRIVRAALRKLGGCPGFEPVEMLGAFVRGHVGASKVQPPLELRVLAVRVLTLRGADGWTCLGNCLSRLGWKLRVDDVELGRAIAGAIRRRPDESGSARVLRRWRWSPAGLFGFLVTRGNSRRLQVHW